MKVKCALTADADGFLTQECPYCNRKFKAAFGEGSRKPLRYCPYCRIQGQNCWHTIEQIKYLHSVAGGSSGTMPPESGAKMPIHRFACHRERIKYDGAMETLCCIICGEQTFVTKKRAAKKAATRRGAGKKPATRRGTAKKPATRRGAAKKQVTKKARP